MKHKIPEGWTPDQPVTPPHYEAFAQSLANGAGPSKAYRAHIAGDGVKSTSVKSSAHHLTRREDVSRRVEFLRRQINERIKEEEKELTGDDLSRLMLEVTEILESAIQTAESSCLASRPQMQKMRDILVQHLGRVGRAVDVEIEDEVTDESPLTAPPWCVCGGV